MPNRERPWERFMARLTGAVLVSAKDRFTPDADTAELNTFSRNNGTLGTIYGSLDGFHLKQQRWLD
jgi:hypothetical protein